MLPVLFLLLASVVSAADEPPAARAKVNGVPIPLSEIQEEVQRVIPRTLFHRNVSPEKMEVFMKDAVEKLIDRELQFQEAKAQGLKADRKQIKNKLEEIKDKFKSGKAFKEALKKSKLTIKDLEARIEKAFLIEKIFQKEVEEKIKATDEEAKAHYGKNVQRYVEMEQIRMRHIMIGFSNSPVEDGPEKEKTKNTKTKEEARAKAEELLAKIKDGGDFAAIAYESSEDPYRVKGGDLGYIHKGRIMPEIEQVAFGLKNGEVMGPVETPEGFYIIKVEDHKQERQLTFDEAKDKIKMELEQEKREARNKEWLSALRGKAKIEYVEQQGAGH